MASVRAATETACAEPASAVEAAVGEAAAAEPGTADQTVPAKQKRVAAIRIELSG
jgi:hypothetical protein